MPSDQLAPKGSNVRITGLNAPFGARCLLTRNMYQIALDHMGLNAPFGTRCFLTADGFDTESGHVVDCLNAPFDARCFLTADLLTARAANLAVS